MGRRRRASMPISGPCIGHTRDFRSEGQRPAQGSLPSPGRLLAAGGTAGIEWEGEDERRCPSQVPVSVTPGTSDLKANDLLKAACHRRAAYWLREALPELNGKEKTSVDAHLRSLYRSHPGLPI